ncbi:hypothetical protein D3C73_430350 [compost metagenome]
MRPIQQLNRFFLLLCAPFLGIMIWLLSIQLSVQIPDFTQSLASVFSINNEAAALEDTLNQASSDAVQTKAIIQKYYTLYEQSTAQISVILQDAAISAVKPKVIYDQRITDKLGSPSRQASSGNIEAQLFSIHENNYDGYALKVKLKSDKAIKLVLGKDRLGSSETTLEAVNRYGAIAGINAGGYADDRNERRFPLDTTVINGKYVNGFFPSANDSIFIGLNKDRQLIGGKFTRQEDLDKLSPLMGATFVPTLLQSGKKQLIPSKWQTSPARAARTVVGNYKDDQLLFLITNGNDESGRSGATLAELQDKLQQLGVKDAYNLDGGGSSTLVFDGSVINRPSDGKLRPLPTHFLFFR